MLFYDKSLSYLIQSLLRGYNTAINGYEAIKSNAEPEQQTPMYGKGWILRQIEFTLDQLWGKWQEPVEILWTLSAKEVEELTGYKVSREQLSELATRLRELETGSIQDLVETNLRQWEMEMDDKVDDKDAASG